MLFPASLAYHILIFPFNFLSDIISNTVAIKDPNENNPVISIIALSALLYSLFAKLEIIPKNAFTAELRNQLTAKPVTRHIILRIVVKNLLNNPLHFGIAVFNRKSKDYLNPNFL